MANRKPLICHPSSLKEGASSPRGLFHDTYRATYPLLIPSRVIASHPTAYLHLTASSTRLMLLFIHSQYCPCRPSPFKCIHQLIAPLATTEPRLYLKSIHDYYYPQRMPHWRSGREGFCIVWLAISVRCLLFDLSLSVYSRGLELSQP